MCVGGGFDETRVERMGKVTLFGGHATSTAMLPMPPAVGVGDEDLYEVIDGERVGKQPMGIYAVCVASELHFHLAYFVRNNQMGWALTEALFHLPSPIHRDRRPAVAFVSYARWPIDKPISLTDNAWDVVPNLATKVVSPTDTIQELGRVDNSSGSLLNPAKIVFGAMRFRRFRDR
jgi:hypothetical protein